jgi:hypothetical protein
MDFHRETLRALNRPRAARTGAGAVVGRADGDVVDAIHVDVPERYDCLPIAALASAADLKEGSPYSLHTIIRTGFTMAHYTSLPRGPCLSRRIPTANEIRVAVVYGARWNKTAAGWLEGGFLERADAKPSAMCRPAHAAITAAWQPFHVHPMLSRIYAEGSPPLSTIAQPPFATKLDTHPSGHPSLPPAEDYISRRHMPRTE